MVMLKTLLLALPLLSPQEAEVTVGLRPQAIRVGDVAVLTVRVISREGLPELVDFVPPPGLQLEDYRDRTSSAVGGGSWVLEREFDLLGQVPGEYALPSIQVVVGGVLTEWPAPDLNVADTPLQWGRRPQERRTEAPRTRREPDPVVPQGSPPSTGEMTEARPQNQGGYDTWGYPGYLFGYPGQIPGMPWMPPMQMPGWGGAQGLYPGYGYSPVPYGPNGGWPIAPPGGAPGVGMGWPGQLGYPGSGAYPGSTFPPGGGYPTGAVSPGTGGYPGTGVPLNGVMQGQGSPYGGGPTLPAIPGGQWPVGMGGGWAETAASDPWWPEIVPELFGYGGWAQAPAGDAALAAGITPVRIFQGQQATLVATATFQPGAFLGQTATPEYIPPAPPDFWVVDLPDPPVPLPTAAQGGVDQGYTFRRALFPLRAGEYLVPPALLLLPLDGGAGGGIGWDTLAADPLPVSVMPVPQAPGLPGYNGAVGRYRMEAGVTPTRLAVGETALLVVRILGVGNTPSIPRPQIPPLFGAEIAPAGDGAVVEVRDGVVGGVRTFTWLLVPTEPGPLRVDPILFSFFDPYLGDFGQVASQDLILDVTEFPGGQGGIRP